MSYLEDSLSAELKAIKREERRSRDGDAANRARHAAWVSYIDERVSQHYLDPLGVPQVAEGM